VRHILDKLPRNREVSLLLASGKQVDGYFQKTANTDVGWAAYLESALPTQVIVIDGHTVIGLVMSKRDGEQEP
jgi:hypothetical protein